MTRFSKQELHPAIFERIQEFSATAMYKTSQSPEHARAINNKSNIFMKEHWLGLSLWGTSVAPILYGFTKAADFGPAAGLFALFSMLTAWGAIGSYGLKKTKETVSIEALENIRPVLEISESEKLYLDCFIEVQKCSLLDSSQKQSWLMALKDALDRSLQLENLRENLRQLSGGQNVQEIQDEMDRIGQLIAESEDTVAQNAYRESLEMVKLRAKKADGAAVQIERTEAHLELTRQTFLRTKEMLTGLSIGENQAVNVDLEPLRANLNRVQTDAQLIVDAIEELNQS